VDANIIFGAVVDPGLNGKVKITVIATGFGSPAVAHPAPSAAQTPVDMTQYADQRLRPGMAVPVPSTADPLTMPRLSLTRRPLLDLPLAAASAATASPAGAEVAAEADAGFDFSSTFDIPAFLRRQEG